MGDGECNACKNHRNNKNNNRAHGKKKLLKLFSQIKRKKKAGYDCLVPVSGGKDSTWQVLTCLNNGLKVLAVTYKSPGRNSLGSQNLKNLVSLGVDHIDFTLNPKVEKYFMLKTFKKKGSTAIPMHFSIYNLPYKFAELFGIPLIVWGENPAEEYGYLNKNDLNLKGGRWWQKHGALSNTSISSWKDKVINKKNLFPLTLNSKIRVKSIFLSDFIEWDPVKIKKIVKKKGFKFSENVKTGIYNFADIDCDFISIHHYLKWYKFGLTRAFDNLSIEIRNKRVSRKKAISMLKMSLKKIRPKDDIKKFCKFVGISIREFNLICEKFRNKKIWEKRGKNWKIKNFLIKNFIWQ